MLMITFFQIGGDFISVVSVQLALERRLGRPVLVAKLFKHFIVWTLAMYLAIVDKANIELEEEPILLPLCVSGTDEDIAIISMSCRLPGGITTAEEY